MSRTHPIRQLDAGTPTTRLSASPVVVPVALPNTAYLRWGKRTFDIVVTTIALVILLPLMALTAIGVLVTMGRPIIFRQQRVGRGGTPFTMLKFRSMHADRRNTAGNFAGEDRRRDHKSDNDPRHNTFGRFIRKCSIDELPQLLNVLRGDMSVVGPRPELVTVATRFGITDHPRHLVRPGLTGPWQISADRPGYAHQNLHYDEAYLTQVSLRTDLAILLRTPLALTRGR